MEAVANGHIGFHAECGLDDFVCEMFPSFHRISPSNLQWNYSKWRRSIRSGTGVARGVQGCSDDHERLLLTGSRWHQALVKARATRHQFPNSHISPACPCPEVAGPKSLRCTGTLGPELCSSEGRQGRTEWSVQKREKGCVKGLARFLGLLAASYWPH